MIYKEYFKAPAPPPVVFPFPHKQRGNFDSDRAKAIKKGDSLAEYDRRSLIVANLLKEVPYAVGDYVRPINEENFKKNGFMLVKDIVQSYDELDRDDWNNGEPYLVFCEKVEADKIVENRTIVRCTTNYVEKGNYVVSC